MRPSASTWTKRRGRMARNMRPTHLEAAAERGSLGEPAKQGAHRADGVAVEPPAPDGECGDQREHQSRDNEGTDSRPMCLDPVDTAEAGGIRQPNHRIVRQREQGTKEPHDHPTEIAVGIEQGEREAAPACGHPGHRAPEKPLP